MNCCVSSAKWLCERATVLPYTCVAYLVQSAIDSAVISTRAVLFVGLVEMRCYSEFRSLVSIDVVRADSLFELDSAEHRNGN
jgi:hypothetical protein